MLLFNRNASLQIGKFQEEGLLLEGFRVAFTVDKTITDEPNKARIEISNLSNDTRKRITPDDGNQVILRAGYEYSSDIIFIGDIVNVHHSATPPETTTTIEAADGLNVFDAGLISLSIQDETNSHEVMQRIIDNIGIPAQKSAEILKEIPMMIFNNGLSFSGFFTDIMNRLSTDMSFDWSVQNNELKITHKDSTSGLVAIRLDTVSGLIGSPSRVREIDIEDADKTFTGWDVESLLQGKAEPADIVEIESHEISPAAQFRIHDVTHIGDTHGAAFMTRMRVKDLV